MRWRSAVGGSWARAGAAVALAKGAARLFAVFDLLIKELIEVGVSEPGTVASTMAQWRANARIAAWR